MTDEVRRVSFDRKAELYERRRPSYPDAAAAAIAARVLGRRALEIGAGTGKATAVVARQGFVITAIEPGANLAAVLAGKQLPGVTIAPTTFEAFDGGADYDLVYAAQAIHWIDPAVRYVKAATLLRPGGTLAVLRNEKQPLVAELRHAFDQAYARWFPVATDLRTPAEVSAEYVAEIDASARFGPVEVVSFPWTARYTTGDYLALLDTYSDHAILAEARRDPLYAALAAAIDGVGGAFDVPYVTLLFLATPRPRP